MKPNFFSILLFTLSSSLFTIFYGCGGGGNNATGNSTISRQSCIDTINAIETKLKTITAPDPYIYNHAITAYGKFYNNFPQDTLAPVCMYKAAQKLMGLNQYQRALTILDTLTAKYSTFKRLPDCIFLQAYIYDDKVKDTAKARAKYQEIITKFPQNPYAEQAKGAIAILGKSYDEIMKEFEAKNKGNTPKS